MTLVSSETTVVKDSYSRAWCHPSEEVVIAHPSKNRTWTMVLPFSYFIARLLLEFTGDATFFTHHFLVR